MKLVQYYFLEFLYNVLKFRDGNCLLLAYLLKFMTIKWMQNFILQAKDSDRYN